MLKSILVALCCLASASAEYVVEELTEAQLRQAIEDTQKVLVVDFYAPWCGSCKKLGPVLDGLAALHGDSLRVAKVDATQYTELAAQFSVSSYPKIKYFLNGRAFDYIGPRTVEDFQSFATRLQMETIVSVSSQAELLDELRAHGVAILLAAGTAGLEDGLVAAFDRAAHAFHGQVRFVQWSGPLTGDMKPGIHKLENGIDFVVPFSGAGAVPAVNPEQLDRALIEFVTFHNREFISTISSKNFKQLGQLGKNFAVVILEMDEAGADSGSASPKHALELQHLRAAVSAVHGDIQDNLVIGVLDSVKHAKYLKKYGASAPCVLVVNMESDSFFLFGQEENVFESSKSLARTLIEASKMQRHDASDDNIPISQLPRRMKSLHQHVRKVGVFEKVQRKIMDYFPLSLLFILVPFSLLAVSLCATNPRNSKKMR